MIINPSQAQQIGKSNTGLIKLSSAASSSVSSKDSSQGQQQKNNNNYIQKIIERVEEGVLPLKETVIITISTQKKKQNQNKTPRRRNQSWRSRSASRRSSNFSNKLNKYQTSKKQAWKNKICKYWKKGQCRYGDQCEWQHYDFTQIDYCEQAKRERYNTTYLNGKYTLSQ